MAKQPFIVFCDGGLCNRLNALLVAQLIAKELEIKLQIAWPTNNWCQLAYSEIFNESTNVVAQSIDIQGLVTKLAKYELLGHEQQTFSKSPLLNPNLEESWQSLIDVVAKSLESQPVIYFNATIPWCCPIQAASKIAQTLSWKPVYQQQAFAFLQAQHLNPFEYWGLHIRGTDFGHSHQYFKRWQNIIKRFADPIVICTDDLQVRDIYFSNQKVISRKIEHFPQRFHADKGWNAQIVDNQDRTFNFNVLRDAASVKESIVDLMVLSQAKLFFTSNSTFLTFALLMRGIEFSIFSRLLFGVRRIKQKIRIIKAKSRK
jgi:hypothetical protein